MILALPQISRDLRDFVQYEFVNFVPTLFFDDMSMCKTQQSALDHIIVVNSSLVNSSVRGKTTVVIDGITCFTPLYRIHQVHSC